MSAINSVSPGRGRRTWRESQRHSDRPSRAGARRSTPLRCPVSEKGGGGSAVGGSRWPPRPPPPPLRPLAVEGRKLAADAALGGRDLQRQDVAPAPADDQVAVGVGVEGKLVDAR